jgi:hypothetical protein
MIWSHSGKHQEEWKEWAQNSERKTYWDEEETGDVSSIDLHKTEIIT